jgi:hypothetical protein
LVHQAKEFARDAAHDVDRVFELAQRLNEPLMLFALGLVRVELLPSCGHLEQCDACGHQRVRPPG